MQEVEPLITRSMRSSASASEVPLEYSKSNENIDSRAHIATRTNLRDARWVLYISHFFNQFSEQAWQFCIALFLAAFTNNQSLMLVTSYGLVTYSFVCLFGSSVGRYIDGSDRLIVARQFIGFENLAVLIATFLCYMLLSSGHDMSIGDGEVTINDPQAATREPIYDMKSISLLIGIHLLGAVAMTLDSGFLVAIERDWIVVMSISASKRQESEREMTKEETENVQKLWLSDTNVKMRQIDLSCKILAPAIGGIFIAFFDDGTSKNNGYDLRGATLLVGGVNVVALIVEYICTAKIYHKIPELAESKNETSNSKQENGGEEMSRSRNTTNGKGSLKMFCDLQVYFSQSVCWAGFSLSLLYLNVVLTFGNIMTVYLVWRGIHLEVIGFWRGIASAAGLSGTFVYHYLANSKNVDLADIGMMSVAFQLSCLCACYASLFVADNRIFVIMLIGGVCFSRIGLWVFDITVTQLMQLHIPAPVRGLVGGVQQSMNAFFTVIIYVVGLFLSDPSNFYIYALISFSGVFLAAAFYGIMFYPKRRKFLSSKDDDSKMSV
mmetsp:Transcript_16686/g.38295  ORF Transcript_16686/g.38295 Transcript_16686/m.38295 type:complete len:551 (-) Transcript_16686:1302-2954(-)